MDLIGFSMVSLDVMVVVVDMVLLMLLQLAVISEFEGVMLEDIMKTSAGEVLEALSVSIMPLLLSVEAADDDVDEEALLTFLMNFSFRGDAEEAFCCNCGDAVNGSLPKWLGVDFSSSFSFLSSFAVSFCSEFAFLLAAA